LQGGNPQKRNGRNNSAKLFFYQRFGIGSASKNRFFEDEIRVKKELKYHKFMKKKLQRSKKLPAVAERISELCDPLVYISETDEPVEAFFHEGEFPDKLLSDKRRSSESAIEAAGADEFFDKVTRDRDWHNADDKKRVAGFRKLEAYMKKHLRDLAFYRIGRIRIDMYVVGLDADGNTVGIRARAVET
jgi:hypothetical protein